MKKVKLAQIAEISTGLSYRRYLDDEGKEFDVILQRSIKKDGIIEDFEKVRMNPKYIKPHHITRPGDILMKMPYPYDVVCVKEKGLVVSDRIAIIRLDKFNHPPFIAHLLTNAHVQKQLYELASAERIAHASLTQIRELELVLPDLITQKKYAELLDTINEKIIEDLKVVEYDRRLKEGILNELWGEMP